MKTKSVRLMARRVLLPLLVCFSSYIGFKLNIGRNDFYSSGQIPLDEVAAGRLDRFGFIDPDDGGRVRSGILGTYYRKEWKDGDVLKADGFLARSLSDLYSNFTFFFDLRQAPRRKIIVRAQILH